MKKSLVLGFERGVFGKLKYCDHISVVTSFKKTEIHFCFENNLFVPLVVSERIESKESRDQRKQRAERKYLEHTEPNEDSNENSKDRNHHGPANFHLHADSKRLRFQVPLQDLCLLSIFAKERSS